MDNWETQESGRLKVHNYNGILLDVHCASRDVGQGEVGRVTRRVLCTWHLLGLAVKKTMYNNNLSRNGVFGVN